MPNHPDTTAAAQALSNLNIALGLESSDLVSLSNSVKDLSSQLYQQYNENAESQKENLGRLQMQNNEFMTQLSSNFTTTLTSLVTSFERHNLESLAQNERNFNNLIDNQNRLHLEQISKQERFYLDTINQMNLQHQQQLDLQKELFNQQTKHYSDILISYENQSRLLSQSVTSLKDIDQVNRVVGSRVDDMRDDLELHRSEFRRLGDTLREIEQRDMIRKANSAFSVDTDDHARIQWPSPLRTPDPDYPALPPTISALKRMSENDLLALSSAHTSVLRSAWIDYGKRGGDLRRELPIRIASSVGFRLGH